MMLKQYLKKEGKKEQYGTDNYLNKNDITATLSGMGYYTNDAIATIEKVTMDLHDNKTMDLQ